MLILGIESSCDESAVALVELDNASRARVHFEEISSQVKLHALYGGVVPELAAREHLANLPILVDRALCFVSANNLEIDLLAVTQGPGLKGCLLIGLEFAKGLSLAKELPLVGVNHIEGHLHAARLDNPDLPESFMALVVSGGHSEIVKVESGLSGLKYEVLARTIDDAAGEAFDKSANLLGFEYPGGARLAALADTVTSSRYVLPKIMRESPGFSFSGLKTAIALLLKKNQEAHHDPILKAELAFAIQEAIVDSLVHKLAKELEKHSVSAVTITGGVASNRRLREKIKSITSLPVFFPSLSHCVDNAAMIALVGGMRGQVCLGATEQMELLYPTEVRPRWPIETL